MSLLSADSCEFSIASTWNRPPSWYRRYREWDYVGSRVADYVIVGAGSAGCVLAETLSARHSVTLIEAGGSDRIPEVAVPAAYSKLFRSDRDWAYSTEPEPGALGRRLFLPRGKMLGGSSSLNAQLYIRGRPSDYDGWAELGATGWDWKSVLPVFVRMENNTRGPSLSHGNSGPMLVTDQRSINPLSRRFVTAAIAAGIGPNPDFNDGYQTGVGYFQVTQKRGRRWSAADAFLRPALRRPTLRLVTGTTVTKVVIANGRAVGVEGLSGGRPQLFRAEAEVILACGTFGTPHLLQLSGVGAPDHLQALGIEVSVENRNVGENLQDHPAVAVVYDSLLGGTLDDAENPAEMARWAMFRRGRLTSPVAEAAAFVKSSDERDEPDLQFHFGPVNFENHGMEPYDGHGFSIGPVLITPESRGSVKAKSADPRQHPAIVTNSLTEPTDLEALVSGVEVAREIAAQNPLAQARGAELHPGPEVPDLEHFVRSRMELLYHPVGTCRMGSDDDSVVDPQLRARGIEGLRIIDASVMPKIISGNTNAPTMMIAARGAELILGQTSNGNSS